MAPSSPPPQSCKTAALLFTTRKQKTTLVILFQHTVYFQILWREPPALSDNRHYGSIHHTDTAGGKLQIQKQIRQHRKLQKRKLGDSCILSNVKKAANWWQQLPHQASRCYSGITKHTLSNGLLLCMKATLSASTVTELGYTHEKNTFFDNMGCHSVQISF